MDGWQWWWSWNEALGCVDEYDYYQFGRFLSAFVDASSPVAAAVVVVALEDGFYLHEIA